MLAVQDIMADSSDDNGNDDHGDLLSERSSLYF